MTEALVGMPASRGSKSKPDLEAVLAAASPAVPGGSQEPGVDEAVAGLLKSLTKLVIETALVEEMSEHLGYGKHAVQGRSRGNSRNGTCVQDGAH